MPLAQPSFLPTGLVQFVEVRNRIGAQLLGSALAGGQLVAIFYDPGGNFLPLMPRFWREQHGGIIMENGFIPSATAWQIGIPNGGEDISIYLDASQIEALARALGTNKTAADPLEETGRPKSMRDRDVQDAVAALKAETAVKRLTRPKAREFLRQLFPDRHITDANFRSIFSAVPTETGRPQKAGKEL
jgi:hypothetical protein